MGDHTESIQLDFDPARVSYRQLLEFARGQGNFQGNSWSRQYRSVVFYHNRDQMETAREMGFKKLEPLGTFTRAEDYHQKYYLQQSSLSKEFYQRYPTARAFTDSTAVMKANAIVGGHLDSERIQQLIPRLGVTAHTAQALGGFGKTLTPGACAAPESL